MNISYTTLAQNPTSANKVKCTMSLLPWTQVLHLFRATRVKEFGMCGKYGFCTESFPLSMLSQRNSRLASVSQGRADKVNDVSNNKVCTASCTRSILYSVHFAASFPYSMIFLCPSGFLAATVRGKGLSVECPSGITATGACNKSTLDM